MIKYRKVKEILDKEDQNNNKDEEININQYNIFKYDNSTLPISFYEDKNSRFLTVQEDLSTCLLSSIIYSVETIISNYYNLLMSVSSTDVIINTHHIY